MGKSVFSERLTQLRKERGLYQCFVANKLGTKPSALSNYESGLREPNLEVLVKIAKYYNVTTDYLTGNEG